MVFWETVSVIVLIILIVIVFKPGKKEGFVSRFVEKIEKCCGRKR